MMANFLMPWWFVLTATAVGWWLSPVAKGTDKEQSREKMLEYQWQIFGVPSIITSDQGSPFVSSWFQTIAEKLGIRQVFSHAYHHQANGRAEMAGQQMQENLRKWNAEQGINWVSALHAILRQIHDLPGFTGFLPNEILFRRERESLMVPFAHAKECEDAELFSSACKKPTEKLQKF